jgi:excinuclease ABC subunit C
VRDEAHRFAIESHRKRRKKDSLDNPELMQIKGLGPKTRQKLLLHYGSMEKIREAGFEDLIKWGLSEKVAGLLSRQSHPNEEE